MPCGPRTDGILVRTEIERLLTRKAKYLLLTIDIKHLFLQTFQSCYKKLL